MSQEGTVISLETEDRGFTIKKDVSEKEGQHVQIDLVITSTHKADSVVTIEESLPPGTEHSQIGFLPDHEPVEWDLADDGTLLLSARLPPEGARRIIYGLRAIEPSEADPLGEEPRVVNIGGPSAEQSGEGGDAEAAEGEAEASGEEASEGVAIETPIDEETAESIAEAIEPHLETGSLDNDPVTKTKVSQLQEDVADMRAYLPAFEEFLGETGRADDIQTELDNLNSRIDDLEDGPDELGDSIEAMEDRLATIEDRLAGIEAWRGAIAAASQAPESVPAEDDPTDDDESAERGEQGADSEDQAPVNHDDEYGEGEAADEAGEDGEYGEGESEAAEEYGEDGSEGAEKYGEDGSEGAEKYG
ncbi:MAG: hypothetical protein V5A24_09615, partial [Haloarculaceae archaeon]